MTREAEFALVNASRPVGNDWSPYSRWHWKVVKRYLKIRCANLNLMERTRNEGSRGTSANLQITWILWLYFQWNYFARTIINFPAYQENWKHNFASLVCQQVLTILFSRNWLFNFILCSNTTCSKKSFEHFFCKNDSIFLQKSHYSNSSQPSWRSHKFWFNILRIKSCTVFRIFDSYGLKISDKK